LSVAAMAISLYAVNEGFLDDVPVEKVVAFESALHAHAKDQAPDLIDKIDTTGAYDDDIAAELKTLVEGFKATGAY